ncbi:MAG: helix-turn-helix domain-containing protein [Nitrosomonas sp.]|nr:helix-turn-helix domain-containing protein [Nitrosomonas sp.]OQW85548.1 MAG: DNA-binding protein [Proteobacteria bacterium ST_bin16]
MSKLSEKTVCKLAVEDQLSGFKIGGSWHFKRENIESWIEQKKKNFKINGNST